MEHSPIRQVPSVYIYAGMAGRTSDVGNFPLPKHRAFQHQLWFDMDS
jgi:hypothetical protein